MNKKGLNNDAGLLADENDSVANKDSEKAKVFNKYFCAIFGEKSQKIINSSFISTVSKARLL